MANCVLSLGCVIGKSWFYWTFFYINWVTFSFFFVRNFSRINLLKTKSSFNPSQIFFQGHLTTSSRFCATWSIFVFVSVCYLSFLRLNPPELDHMLSLTSSMNDCYKRKHLERKECTIFDVGQKEARAFIKINTRMALSFSV